MIELIGRIGLSSLLLLQVDSLKSSAVPVLTRDVDKRPLLQVRMAELPSAMRKAVLTVVKEKPKPRIVCLRTYSGCSSGSSPICAPAKRAGSLRGKWAELSDHCFR